ncbi:hypothetical protein BZA05DRAFT_416740 [Tricharina praecox]|uniref:uncharacterized protein n=1 Tax=Tricharina praecox TaxID=43433 RepID=UPI00222101CB|nr:uncharacterized protein BZA05DRAFT_416740 [Tricharina praecox]KAI5855147.1 hypothetical protein BZA05DRAFT_416740 [Tricharina praecox]
MAPFAQPWSGHPTSTSSLLKPSTGFDLRIGETTANGAEQEIEPQKEAPRTRWMLAEAYQNAIATGVQYSGRIVEDFDSSTDQPTPTEEFTTQTSNDPKPSSSATQLATVDAHSSLTLDPLSESPSAKVEAATNTTIGVSDSPSTPVGYGRIIVFVDDCRLVMGGVSKKVAIPTDAATGALLEWAFIDFADRQEALMAMTTVLA